MLCIEVAVNRCKFVGVQSDLRLRSRAVRRLRLPGRRLRLPVRRLRRPVRRRRLGGPSLLRQQVAEVVVRWRALLVRCNGRPVRLLRLDGFSLVRQQGAEVGVR
jgi:hypothetical protein